MAPSLATQICAPITLLAGTFLLGVLPITVRKKLLHCGCDGPECKVSCRARKGKVVTSFLIYLGGGVLLATCLVHLLPEAREGFENYEKLMQKQKLKDGGEAQKDGDEEHESFSMPEFVTCCGFFAVYLVEEIIHFFLGSHHHIPTESRAIRSFSRSNSCHSGSYSGRSITVLDNVQTTKDESVLSSPACTDNQNEKSNPATHCCTCAGFSVTSLLTVAALSFHSLFEGFAIGIQDTDSKVWILFAAVSVHKFVIAFVVGLEVLAGGGKDTLVYIYMSIFASMSPLGMMIAMITQNEVEGSAPLTVGILNAIATGTLLYVTFCEILQREEHTQNLAGWQQFIATLTGFVIMCLVQFFSTLA